MPEKQQQADDLPQEADTIKEPVEPAVKEPVEPAVEPAVTLDFWARRNAFRVVGDERVPAAPLMAGFVHRMRERGTLAAKPSEYQRLWAKFQKE